MASITLDGRTATRATVLMPRVGAWTADVVLDGETGPTGVCTLAVDGSTWRGTVVEGAAAFGAWSGRIVGGAGGLRRTLGALPVRGATLAVVLAQTLQEAGETLASGAADLSAVATWWSRPEAPAHHAVADVARAAGYVWRVRADGSVWLGAETWPTYTPAGAVDVLDDDPRVGRLELAGETLEVLPGQTLMLPGRAPARVGCVEHRATADALRTVVLVEREASGTAGRLLEALDAIVRRITRRIDHLALYPATVRAQQADGSLDVVADDPRIAIPARIPYRTLRGVALTVAAGARVLVTFEGGDPTRPVALLWEPGPATMVRVNGGTQRVARVSDTVHAGTVTATIVAGSVLFTYTPHGGAPGAPGPTLTLSGGRITSGAAGFEA